MTGSANRLAAFLASTPSVTVLTGAGVSTGSGIPGYRDRNGNWKHARPVQYADFVGSERWRQRYWARSFVGWLRFRQAAPNAAHAVLAALEDAGRVDTLITQNVDGLHDRAGSRRTIDLHGRLDRVRCLACDARFGRHEWQDGLHTANPGWQATSARSRPDGDAELDAEAASGFRVPDCTRCGGIVKPDVVFFGESVPRERVASARSSVERSDALLVIGSSLMVFSGLRFVRQAVELGKPVAILNQGVTRGDALASLKIEGDCGDVLDKTLQILGASPRTMT